MMWKHYKYTKMNCMCLCVYTNSKYLACITLTQRYTPYPVFFISMCRAVGHLQYVNWLHSVEWDFRNAYVAAQEKKRQVWTGPKNELTCMVTAVYLHFVVIYFHISFFIDIFREPISRWDRAGESTIVKMKQWVDCAKFVHLLCLFFFYYAFHSRYDCLYFALWLLSSAGQWRFVVGTVRSCFYYLKLWLYLNFTGLLKWGGWRPQTWFWTTAAGNGDGWFPVGYT